MPDARDASVFRVTQLTDSWQVVHEARRFGPYATHCQAALAAMLLAELAVECNAGTQVVLEQGAAPPRILWTTSGTCRDPASIWRSEPVAGTDAGH